MEEFYWKWRAFWWGFFHPLASEEEHQLRAWRAAREQLRRAGR